MNLNTEAVEKQITCLSEKIKNLSLHLKKHKKDFSSKRAIYKLSKKNKKLRKYIKNDNKKIV